MRRTIPLLVSALLRAPARGTAIAVAIEVRDERVAHAFLRVAWYGEAGPRRLATVDSAPLATGRRVRVRLTLEPPPGTVAYRARILGRLVPGATGSARGAIVVRELLLDVRPPEPGPRRTRLTAAPREARSLAIE